MRNNGKIRLLQCDVNNLINNNELTVSIWIRWFLSQKWHFWNQPKSVFLQLRGWNGSCLKKSKTEVLTSVALRHHTAEKASLLNRTEFWSMTAHLCEVLPSILITCTRKFSPNHWIRNAINRQDFCIECSLKSSRIFLNKVWDKHMKENYATERRNENYVCVIYTWYECQMLSENNMVKLGKCKS